MLPNFHTNGHGTAFGTCPFFGEPTDAFAKGGFTEYHVNRHAKGVIIYRIEDHAELAIAHNSPLNKMQREDFKIRILKRHDMGMIPTLRSPSTVEISSIGVI